MTAFAVIDLVTKLTILCIIFCPPNKYDTLWKNRLDSEYRLVVLPLRLLAPE